MKDFSPKQEKLLAALLSEKDLHAASKKSGISETTIWRYLKDEGFAAEYDRLRRAAVEQAAARLQQTANEAVDALRRNLTCHNPQAEISAARIILDNVFINSDNAKPAAAREIVISFNFNNSVRLSNNDNQ